MEYPGFAASSSFISPEARATGGVKNFRVRPPCPWNEDLVDCYFVEYNAESEQPPDTATEWAIRAGREADAGRRRYSAYFSIHFRDGPQLDGTLHPSRSALRPLASCPVRSIAANCMEAAQPASEGARDDGADELGSAADSLECRFAGTHTFPLSDGREAPARGACSPSARPRRPFTGLRHAVVAPCAAALMEAHPAVYRRRGPPRIDPALRHGAAGEGLRVDDVDPVVTDEDASSDSS